MEHITYYLTDPETWNHVTQAFAKAAATRLLDRMLHYLQRPPRRRSPQHRADDSGGE